MWFRKTEASGSSATRHDPITQQEPVQQQAAPYRSSATALLSGAQIWSSGDSSNSDPVIAEPVVTPAPVVEAPLPITRASEPVREPLPSAVVADAPDVAPLATQPVIAEMILAATGMKPTAVEVKLPATTDRSLAQTIVATPALAPAPRQ